MLSDNKKVFKYKDVHISLYVAMKKSIENQILSMYKLQKKCSRITCASIDINHGRIMIKFLEGLVF